MLLTERKPTRVAAYWLWQPVRWLLGGLWFFLRAGVIAWASLAIYFSNLPWPWLRLALAAGFMVFGAWALWRSRTRRALLAFGGAYLGVVVWWSFIHPSHHRPWRPEVAVMPRVSIDGDRVRIAGVRNFEYRGTYDFTPRYEEREVSLSSLTSIDFFISYWMQGPVGHTFLSFNFSNAPPVCISIETRPEVGEGFDPLASLFKQFELIYVVGDERDLVRVRTNFRRDDVYLYHIRTSAENARRLFLIYLDRINELYDQPEFYHLLSNSCTINIVRYARAVGKPPGFDIRHFLNGLIDSYLYSIGAIDTTLPFAELRRRSRINDAALAADNAADFSERIRAAVPSPGE